VSKPDAHTSPRLSPADAAAAQRICERVEGIPLAIELAAARTTLLTFTELANALDRSLRYLYVSHADDEIALRDVMIADSFPRLNPAEKLLLSRLSVFCGQFTSAAAAAICLDDPSATDEVDTLSLLVSKSLVLRGDDVAGVATFRLLRVIREFAEDRFSSDPDSYQVRRRFAHYFRDLAARAAPHFVDGGQETWSSVLDAESDDLRRAFAWCLRHDPHSALVMVGSLWRWWHLRGHYQEGRSSATAAVRASSSAPPELRGHALTAAGMLALLQCDYEAAQSHIQQGLDLYSFAADHAGVRWSLALLGQVAVQRGEYTVGGQLHEQALVLARRTQDPREVAIQQNALAQVAWLRGDFVQAADRAQSALDTLSALDDQQGVVWGLINLGIAARYRGDLTGAQDLLTHSLRRSERSNYREGVAWSLNQLGVVSRLNQDYQTARAQQDRSLDGHRALGNRWRAASALDELAAVAIATGDVENATIQLAEAAQLRHEIGAPLPLAEQPAREHTLAEARRRNAPAAAELTLAGSPQHHR
jgi:tetratricopeptide (TPR) repeat protein